MSPQRLVLVEDAGRSRQALQRSRLLWGGGAALLMLVVTVQPFRDTDVWWHLALGQLITAHGIPAQEPFSFLPAAHPWVGQQWLYEVLLSGLVGAGGAGLASLLMGIAAAAALFIAATSTPRFERVPGPWLAVAIVFSGLVVGQVAGVRGQVLTLLGFACVLAVLARWREGRTVYVWLLPPLFLLWANVHAGFVSGIALALAGLLIARPADPASKLDRRALGTAIGISLLATLLNPAGLALYGYVAETFGNSTLTQVVNEWASPDFHNLWLQLFEAQAVLLVVLWTLGGGLDRFHLATAVAAFVATLLAQRNVSLFALVAAPQIALYGTRAWRLHVLPRLHRPASPPRRLRTAAAGAALAAMTAAVTLTVLPTVSPASAAGFEASRYPRAAVDFVEAHASGQRIYTEDTWGGYLAYRLLEGPWSRVIFLYDETAVFGNTALQRYLDIHLLRPDWLQVLQEENIGIAIVGSSSQEAAAFSTIGWYVACVDRTSSSVVMWNPRAAPPSALTQPLAGAC